MGLEEIMEAVGLEGMQWVQWMIVWVVCVLALRFGMVFDSPYKQQIQIIGYIVSLVLTYVVVKIMGRND